MFHSDQNITFYIGCNNFVKFVVTLASSTELGLSSLATLRSYESIIVIFGHSCSQIVPCAAQLCWRPSYVPFGFCKLCMLPFPLLQICFFFVLEAIKYWIFDSLSSKITHIPLVILFFFRKSRYWISNSHTIFSCCYVLIKLGQ